MAKQTGYEQGVEQGIEQGIEQIVINMKVNGLSNEEIEKISNLSSDKILN